MAESRQMFAAFALGGLVACRDYGLMHDCPDQVKETLAKRSWELADAMLAAETPPAPEPAPADTTPPETPPPETPPAPPG